ncbi:MAG: XRE family transcriptional regulator [Pseudomonas sp.]|nr:MAG: XRE family transcriptional regulator [Pseudomonas sp.]
MPTPSPKYAQDPALLALGAAIRSTRLEQGLAQEELAFRSQIERSYMSSIERGMQNVGVMTLVRLAKELEISLASLMSKAKL